MNENELREMSMAEQMALFDSLLTVLCDTVPHAIGAALPKILVKPTDARVAKYVAMREASATMQKSVEALLKNFTEAMETIANSMLADLQAQGASSLKTAFGTVYKVEETRYSIADARDFYDFVLDLGDLDFLERRVKSSHVAEWMAENGKILPPGLDMFRTVKARVRKS